MIKYRVFSRVVCEGGGVSPSPPYTTSSHTLQTDRKTGATLGLSHMSIEKWSQHTLLDAYQSTNDLIP